MTPEQRRQKWDELLRRIQGVRTELEWLESELIVLAGEARALRDDEDD